MQNTWSHAVSPQRIHEGMTPNARMLQRIVPWRLRGALDLLESVVIVTSYGYALCLELAGEPILLELQRTLEQLTDKGGGR